MEQDKERGLTISGMAEMLVGMTENEVRLAEQVMVIENHRNPAALKVRNSITGERINNTKFHSVPPRSQTEDDKPVIVNSRKVVKEKNYAASRKKTKAFINRLK